MKFSGNIERDGLGGFRVAVELNGISDMEKARSLGGAIHDTVERWLGDHGLKMAIGADNKQPFTLPPPN